MAKVPGGRRRAVARGRRRRCASRSSTGRATTTGRCPRASSTRASSRSRPPSARCRRRPASRASSAAGWGSRATACSTRAATSRSGCAGGRSRRATASSCPTREVDRLDWLTVPQAVRRVTAGTDDGTLQRFAACARRTSTVLLVRHALAGRRDEWAGDDDVRPLDEAGGAQARALRRPAAAVGADGRAERAGAALPLDGGAGGRAARASHVEVDDDLAEDAAERLPAPAARARRQRAGPSSPAARAAPSARRSPS